jgi:hypothetical protein
MPQVRHLRSKRSRRQESLRDSTDDGIDCRLTRCAWSGAQHEVYSVRVMSNMRWKTRAGWRTYGKSWQTPGQESRPATPGYPKTHQTRIPDTTRAAGPDLPRRRHLRPRRRHLRPRHRHLRPRRRHLRPRRRRPRPISRLPPPDRRLPDGCSRSTGVVRQMTPPCPLCGRRAMLDVEAHAHARSACQDDARSPWALSRRGSRSARLGSPPGSELWVRARRSRRRSSGWCRAPARHPAAGWWAG